MTLRPAYYQFAWFGAIFYPDEAQQRLTALRQLYLATSVADAQAILAQAAFDYLLVYSDMQPRLDMLCCMDLVHDGEPKIFKQWLSGQ